MQQSIQQQKPENNNKIKKIKKKSYICALWLREEFLQEPMSHKLLVFEKNSYSYWTISAVVS